MGALDFIWESLLSWIQTTVLSCVDLVTKQLVYAFSPNLITFDEYFPGATTLWNIVYTCSAVLIIALYFWKLFSNQLSPFSRTYESPITLTVKMVLAYVVMINIGGVINAFMGLADTVYWKILDNATITNGNMFSNLCDSVKKSFLDNDSSGMNIVEALVAFILTIPIAWNYFKLVLEMAERYVVIGVMYYTMPLACVPIVSKDTDAITRSWIRMFFSELLILVLNLWFMVIFQSAITDNPMEKSVTVNGYTCGGILWCFIALAFLKTAQSIDSHIAALGLTTAQLGQGVANTLLATGGGLRRGARIAQHAFGLNPAAVFAGNASNGTTRTQRKAAQGLSKQADSVKSVSDPTHVKNMGREQSYKFMKDRPNFSLNGEAARAYAEKFLPENMKEQLSKGEFLGGTAQNGNFELEYKDQNGKLSKMSYSETQPDGISQKVNFGETSGFLKNTGSPYQMNDINDGSSYKEFAQAHLNGTDSFLDNSGFVSSEELKGSTISPADDGSDSLILRDADGYEIARISPFNDQHADNLSDNTVIGEGSDGLYRADFNTTPKMPLPDGYEYAGDVCFDANNNPVPENEIATTEGTHFQESYKTPDGNYISAGEMDALMHDQYIFNDDYAGNISYASNGNESGFVDANGKSLDLSKAGWSQTENPDIYQNAYTGCTATGEQIAANMASPQYAAQSYGGIDNEGNPVYFDNASKIAVSNEAMENAPKYGEASSIHGLYNSETGSFDAIPNASNGIGKNVEDLLDKDYSFSGSVGANVSKAYMPELKNEAIESASLDKDTLTVQRKVDLNGNEGIKTDHYWSNIADGSTNKVFQKVNSAGSSTWYKVPDRQGDTSYRETPYAASSSESSGTRRSDNGRSNSNEHSVFNDNLTNDRRNGKSQSEPYNSSDNAYAGGNNRFTPNRNKKKGLRNNKHNPRE